MKQSYNDSGLTAKRSYRRFIVGLTALAVSLALQAQDFARLGERTIMGTARYVGMSGAMSAIGGDPTAVMDNVAGLGLYRRPEMLITFDYMTDKSKQPGSGAEHAALFMAPHASAIFSLASDDLSAVRFHNFMLSYHRLHTFNRTCYGYAENSPSLGDLLNTVLDLDMDVPDYPVSPYNLNNDLVLRESGYVNTFAFDYAMNIRDRWYVGLGLRIQSYSLSSEGDYFEAFDALSPDLKNYSINSVTRFLFSGVGASLSAGVIYRPLQWLRIGFGLETPSIGSYDATTAGVFYAQTDTAASSPTRSRYEEREFHMPLHTSSSVAFQISHYALIALQHDYFHQAQAADRHSLRLGVEVTPYAGVFLNAGYAYESTFAKDLVFTADRTMIRQDTYFQNTKQTQYISGGVGYRGRWFMVQAAYQYKMQKLNLYAHENITEPYHINTDTHRVVLTFGWHR